MPIDSTIIQQHGWRQGSIFTLQASAPIIVAHRGSIATPQFVIADDSRLILVSHDCDVVHPGPHEPRIEVCPAVPLPGALNGNFTGTRNPRRLHIELEVKDDLRGHELRAPTRFFLPREILQDSAPDPDVRIASKHRLFLSHWLAKRVKRTALPTAFDQRVPQQTRSEIRNLLAPLADSIHSLMIALEPDNEELTEQQSYKVQIVALMAPADYAQAPRREFAEAAMGGIEKLLDACDGIDLEVCVCQSMADMTLDVYLDFSVWDYDELSLNTGIAPPQPVP